MQCPAIVSMVILACQLSNARAGCYQSITSACERNICMSIEWNCEIPGYEKDFVISISTVKREKNANGQHIVISTEQNDLFRFNTECTWTSHSKSQFRCKPRGLTFLAGRSYKRQRYGVTESCPDPDTGKTGYVPNYRFVCISGCTKKSSFRILKDEVSGNCD